VTGYVLKGLGARVRVPVRKRMLYSALRPDRFWGPARLPIEWVPRAFSAGLKLPVREADH
jgi:hypothetical protein